MWIKVKRRRAGDPKFFINIVSVIMFVVVILGVIFTEPLVNLIVSGYDQETLALTVKRPGL
jgi:hypothetical protein